MILSLLKALILAEILWTGQAHCVPLVANIQNDTGVAEFQPDCVSLQKGGTVLQGQPDYSELQDVDEKLGFLLWPSSLNDEGLQ